MTPNKSASRINRQRSIIVLLSECQLSAAPRLRYFRRRAGQFNNQTIIKVCAPRSNVAPISRVSRFLLDLLAAEVRGLACQRSARIWMNRACRFQTSMSRNLPFVSGKLSQFNVQNSRHTYCQLSPPIIRHRCRGITCRSVVCGRVK